MKNRLIKPFTTSISTITSELKAVSISLTYNANTNQYSSVDIIVKNYGAVGHSGIIYVILKDTNETVIASGSKTTDTIIASATTSVSVSLTWAPNKTVNDVASILIVIAQAS
jgi:hypothetical protein